MILLSNLIPRTPNRYIYVKIMFVFKLIDAEIDNIIEECAKRCREMVTKHKADIEKYYCIN